MMLVKTTGKKIPELEILIKGQKTSLKAKQVENGNLEYVIPGNSKISINTIAKH
jgi:hypothetical protein